MAKKERAAKKPRPRAGLLTKVVILALLVGIGWQLHSLQEQVESAQAERDYYADRVEQQQRENDALKADIAEGVTPEKIEEIARDELGLVTPGEYVIYDTSN